MTRGRLSKIGEFNESTVNRLVAEHIEMPIIHKSCCTIHDDVYEWLAQRKEVWDIYCKEQGLLKVSFGTESSVVSATVLPLTEEFVVQYYTRESTIDAYEPKVITLKEAEKIILNIEDIGPTIVVGEEY